MDGLRRLTGLALASLCVAGCGGDKNPFDMAAVSGKVTYAGGNPIDAAHVTLRLVPQGIAAVGGKSPRPAEGKLQADGSFSELSTARFGDGAIVGRYKVILETYNADSTLRPAAVAARYRDPAQTPLVVEVTRDGPNRFDLTVEKGP